MFSILSGDLTDISENKTNVLGFVGVAAVNIERVYFDRDTVQGTPVPFDRAIIPEPCIPPRAPCAGGNKTSVHPEEWPN